MKLRDYLELGLAVVAGGIGLLLLVSTSIKQNAKTPCDYVCKTPNYCTSEKSFEGDKNTYTEIECKDGSKYIITEVK